MNTVLLSPTVITAKLAAKIQENLYSLIKKTLGLDESIPPHIQLQRIEEYLNKKVTPSKRKEDYKYSKILYCREIYFSRTNLTFNVDKWIDKYGSADIQVFVNRLFHEIQTSKKFYSCPAPLTSCVYGNALSLDNLYITMTIMYDDVADEEILQIKTHFIVEVVGKKEIEEETK
jgi:hypothetical protein